MARLNMDVNEMFGVVEVKLSRRNLLTLLHDLESERGTGYICNGDTWVNGKRAPLMLELVSEPDEQHYADRPAGAMNPETEEFLVEQGCVAGVRPEDRGDQPTVLLEGPDIEL